MKQKSLESIKLETRCFDLKKSGMSIRNISSALSDEFHMKISSSWVHRCLLHSQKEESTNMMNQVAEPPQKIMKINLSPPEKRRAKRKWTFIEI
jgi:intein-encoded DNA endonuclease-like protein